MFINIFLICHVTIVSYDHCGWLPLLISNHNTPGNSSSRICVLNKPEDINLNASKMIKEINKIKHISCKCRCKFDTRKYNLKPKWNKNKGQCEWKKLIKYRGCKLMCL